MDNLEKIERETDKQTDGAKERQTERKRDRQRQTASDRQTEGKRRDR